MISPELLRRYPFFAGFTDQQLKGLAMLAQEETFGAGSTIFREGDVATKCYLITEGKVDILITLDEASHRSVSISSLGPGEWLAWSGVVPPHVLTASAQAAGTPRLVAFDAAGLLAMCEVDCAFGLRLMSQIARAVSERLHATRVQLMSLVAPSE